MLSLKIQSIQIEKTYIALGFFDAYAKKETALQIRAVIRIFTDFLSMNYTGSRSDFVRTKRRTPCFLSKKGIIYTHDPF